MASGRSAQDVSPSSPDTDTKDKGQNIAKIDFRFDENPAVRSPGNPPKYPLSDLSENEELNKYPEMNFRELADTISWNDTEPLTHGIHRHPAIFIPHIPRYLINTFSDNLNKEGEQPIVLDPFCGSGTTGVEAKVAGRNFVGVEINPLSRLVGQVATTPIPYTVLENVKKEVVTRLEDTPCDLYDDYDVEFLDRTDKYHWFEDSAIEGLTTIRKVIIELLDDEIDFTTGIEPRERKVISDLDNQQKDLDESVACWLTLMIANTVFEVSNADPDVSKAHKSPKMREKIKNGEYPPDPIETYKEQLNSSAAKLIDLWNEVYKTNAPGGTNQSVTINGAKNSTLHRYSDNWVPVDENRSHQSNIDIRLGDARTFSYPEYHEQVDLAITSPPYINAINYYRGTKLRLFWIHDLLEDITELDVEKLKRSIIGSNYTRIKDIYEDLPYLINEEWTGTWEEYGQTNLPALDEHILKIHNGELNEANHRAYLIWKFFVDDMLKTLTRVFEHLKPGAYFFFVIGENTIGGRHIQSHKFVADIAENLGMFKNQDADIGENEGYRIAGMAWDDISNRGLFHNRDHESGVIEREWVVILQKPK